MEIRKKMHTTSCRWVKRLSFREQCQVMFDDCSVPCWMLIYQKCYISCLTYTASSKNRASFNVVWKWDYEDAGRSANHLFREIFVLQCFFRCHSWVIVTGRIVGVYSKISFRMVAPVKNETISCNWRLNWINMLHEYCARVYSPPEKFNVFCQYRSLALSWI